MVLVKVLSKGSWLSMVEHNGIRYEVFTNDLHPSSFSDYMYIQQSKLWKIWG